MTDAEVQARINKAFSSVPRPDMFTSCECWECRDLSALLQQRDNDSIRESDRDFLPTLLSPEAFRYFIPGLVRLALLPEDTDGWGISETFIGILCVPISKKSPPACHPKASLFNAEQTSAVLAFLTHIHDTPCDDYEDYDDYDGSTREINRGVRNWKHFAKSFSWRSRINRFFHNILR